MIDVSDKDNNCFFYSLLLAVLGVHKLNGTSVPENFPKSAQDFRYALGHSFMTEESFLYWNATGEV